MGDRDYSSATEAALFAVSVKCYYPNCQVPTVNIFDGEGESKNVQIAHIYAAKPGGPRFDPQMTKEERKSFRNLILLCDLHHNLVDKREPQKYSASILLRWKQENEKAIRAKLDGLDRLTEDRLEQMLFEAAQSTKQEIMGALDELKDVSEGAAYLLRELYEKIERHYLDRESIALLDAASQRLYYLEEGSNLIHEASCRLGHLEENAGILARAAQQIDAESLLRASQRLEQFAHDYASMLRDTPEVPDISGSIEMASRSLVSEIKSTSRSLISEIERRVDSVNGAEPPLVTKDEQRWKFAAWGFVAGVLAVMVTVMILASRGTI